MPTKKPGKSTKAKALDKALRGMFQKLERRPIPDHIQVVVDQLTEIEKAPLKKARRG